MGEFNFTNILDGDEIDDLFTDPTPTEDKQEETEETPREENQENTITEEVDPETLFEDAQPESVGNAKKKEENKEQEEPTSSSEDGTSPNNFYSSIANALTEEGIFPDLDEETINKVETAEDFRDLIEAQINAGLEEKQKRVLNALDNGVEPSQIKMYENTLNYLSSITENQLKAESEEGENLRKKLIYQDFINRGYSQQKAQKYTERTIENGTDIEDAREAYQSNKEFFQEEYNTLLQEADKKAAAIKKEQEKQAEELKQSIMKDENLFGDMSIDTKTRQKVYDNIAKPVYKDPDKGQYLTAIQKFQKEHPNDFLKYVSLTYTLTKGFKDFESFTKGKVKKEVKKGLKELEHTLNNTRRTSGGVLNLVTNAKDDPESFIGKGLKLDI